MHSIRIVTLVTLLALGGLLAASPARALPLTGAPAIGAAANQGDFRQDVRYVCRRVWRCGYYGCGWRRSCWWTPGPYAYVYPYYSYRRHWRPYRYYSRPYWRRHYRRW
jgi:hypothetical protein